MIAEAESALGKGKIGKVSRDYDKTTCNFI